MAQDSSSRGTERSNSPSPGISDAAKFSLLLMAAGDLTGAMHSFLEGEHQYFLGQGYTEEQARAMAASVFTTFFGGKIDLPKTPDGEDNPT